MHVWVHVCETERKRDIGIDFSLYSEVKKGFLGEVIKTGASHKRRQCASLLSVTMTKYLRQSV
jgi:hypothetical protein